jgi:iron complex outermembrane receptor protein
VRLNEAVFYVKYHDAIRQVVVPTTNANGQAGEETLFRNAAGITNYGIENEFTAQLAPGLILRVPLSYQHCKYDSFTSAGQTYDLTTLPVSRCPEWTATWALNYSVPVAATGGLVSFDVSDNYTAKNLYTFSIASNAPDTRTYEDARALLDASLTYSAANDRWFVRALGKNLTNKFYRIDGQNVDPLWVDVQYGEPRTLAVQFGVKLSLD